MNAGVTDDAVRQEITEATDQSYVVLAGAGTGKTKLVVDRMVSALIYGAVEPEEIVAITFTEAAASEMRERVRAELTMRSGSSAGDDSEVARAQSVLSRLDAARISTIHSFARSIVSEFALQAGVPPGFRVVDPAIYSSEVQERWRHFVEEVAADPEGASLLEVLLALRFDLRRNFGRILSEFTERYPHLLFPSRLGRGSFPGDGPECAPGYAAEALWERKKESIAPEVADLLLGSDLFEAVELLDDHDVDSELSPAARRAAARCVYLADRLDTWASSAEPRGTPHDATADVVLLHKAASELRGLISRSRAGRASAASAAGARIEGAVKPILESIRQECAASVLALMGRFVSEEARRRRGAGELTFGDLLTIALELLDSRPDIRRRLSERYKYFLIDEFQDTDPVQVQLAFSILGLYAPLHPAGEETGSSSTHAYLRPEPSECRLLIVGDRKQSIYSFRGARPALLEKISERWSKYVRRLESTFRCRPEIVGFVNSVFANALASSSPGERASYEPLSPARSLPEETTSGPGDSPRVRLIGGRRDETAEEIRTEEMSHIAAVIREAMGEGDGPGWVVEKETTDGASVLESPSFSDIAVLIRGRTWLPALERVFGEEGIPYRLETGGLLYSTQEAADLGAVLRCIDDPTDAIGVVAALKSSVFSCSDQDLLDYFESRGRNHRCWQYTSHPAENPPEAGTSLPRESASAAERAEYVASCMAVLEDAYADARRLSTPHLLERVVRRQKIFEGALLGRHREQWRRYRLIIDDCRKFFEETGGSIRDFLAWMRLMQDEGAGGAENICAEPDDDSVRILTIHGSKGLEFPIVFAVGALGGRNRSQGKSVLVGPDGSIELKLGAVDLGIKTPGYDDLRSRESVEEMEEDVRLAYVAFTRARDYLVVSLYEGERKGGGGAAPKPVRAAIEALLETADEPGSSADAPAAAASHEAVFDWGVVGIDPTSSGKAGSEGTPQPEAGRSGARASPTAPPDRRTLVLQRLGSTLDGLALRQPVFSATELAGVLAPYDFTRSSGSAPDGGREGDPLAVGRVVHGVLARLDLTAGSAELRSAVPEVVRRLVRTLEEGGVPEAAAASLVERALELRVLGEARSRRHWKELYVCAPGPKGSAVEGFADLVVEARDGLVVADYKTDALSTAGAPDELQRHYAYQVAAYAYALGRATRRPISGCYLLFLGDAEPVEAEIEDVSSRISEIEGCLADLSAERSRVRAEAGVAAVGAGASSTVTLA